MNERIQKLAKQADLIQWDTLPSGARTPDHKSVVKAQKFAELIVKEMCGMMEQAEDDAYHCFEPSERPTEYIKWLRNWQERFTKQFGVEE